MSANARDGENICLFKYVYYTEDSAAPSRFVFTGATLSPSSQIVHREGLAEAGATVRFI